MRMKENEFDFSDSYNTTDDENPNKTDKFLQYQRIR
jgi:hypothetical protein